MTHRYTGIGTGLVVLLWCLSGVVMMYFPFPTISSEERLAGSSTIDIDTCCNPSLLRSQDAVIAVEAFVVEMWNESPVMRATLTSGEVVLFSLRDGREFRELERANLHSAGEQFGNNAGFSLDRTDSFDVENIYMDQWTVESNFNSHRPMLLFSASDGTEWYISSRTGEVVQLTYSVERFGNWIGSVVHWLYPTFLRKHTLLWSQLVIWLTIIALFLTLTGLVIGIKQFGVRKGASQASSANSPYQGWNLWHHYIGLASGAFLLMWLFSGLVSMNPWGALEGRSFNAERERFIGPSVALSSAFRFIANLGAVPAATVRIESNIVDGAIQAVALTADDQATRFSAAGELDPVSLEEAAQHAKRIKPDGLIAGMDTLDVGDEYYYEHHDDKPFPVHRVTFRDGERFYFSQSRGRMELAIDVSRKWYRWLFRAMHTGDFHPVARARPLWDGWMLVVLFCLSAGSLTGVYLAYRRLRQ